MTRDRPFPPPSFDARTDEFAFRLFDQLRGSTGNVWFSPLSTRASLAMAYAGARGETARQIREALHFPEPDGRDAESSVLAMGQPAGERRDTVTIANSMWTQEGVRLEPDFLERVARLVRGEHFAADFRGDAEAARARINRWAAERTRDRIREPLPHGSLGVLDRLVLVNAVYFKGTWAQPFMESETTLQPFFTAGGDTVQAPLMYRQGRSRYAHADGVQVVGLTYEQPGWELLVILPDARDGLGAVEDSCSAGWLDGLVTQLEPREVSLHLPRFGIRGRSMDLGPQLRALGMSAAFDGDRADFSGINGRLPPDPEALFLGAARHQAMLDLDESGTVAAAWSALRMTVGAMIPNDVEPVPVRVDHPFLLMIRHYFSGEVLFLGRIANPVDGTA